MAAAMIAQRTVWSILKHILSGQLTVIQLDVWTNGQFAAEHDVQAMDSAPSIDQMADEQGLGPNIMKFKLVRPRWDPLGQLCQISQSS